MYIHTYTSSHIHIHIFSFLFKNKIFKNNQFCFAKAATETNERFIITGWKNLWFILFGIITMFPLYKTYWYYDIPLLLEINSYFCCLFNENKSTFGFNRFLMISTLYLISFQKLENIRFTHTHQNVLFSKVFPPPSYIYMSCIL